MTLVDGHKLGNWKRILIFCPLQMDLTFKEKLHLLNSIMVIDFEISILPTNFVKVLQCMQNISKNMWNKIFY